jgi:tetratricopeptide (TPR) repeat protein
MFPIFFSVSSDDIAFAEKVWKPFPDDWVYLYSKTGEEGAHMWDEISRRELPQTRLFVVFWSKNYITGEGCVREIQQAKDLINLGQLQAVVLRLDDFPISWNEELGENTKPAYEALGVMLDHRTSSPHLTVHRAIDLVQRVVEPILGSDHPTMPRHDLLQTLRRVVKKDRFTYYPAVWVSGFNGVGRETLIRDFCRSFSSNGQGIIIEVNEATLPRQMRLRIESEAFAASVERLNQLSAAPISDEVRGVADAVEQVFAAGNYVIFRHSRIVEENVDLPEWLDDVVNSLSPATRPKLFIISQLPLLAERRTRCRESLVAQRVPTVDEYQLIEYGYQLIGHFDKNPIRWADTEIERIVRASRGNIGFLVSLIRAASGIEDFDQIDQLIASDDTNMGDAITVYVRWAFSQLRDSVDEQRALLFLNDVSPCDLIDIEKVVSPTRPILRVLGKLLELGLIEREGDNLYHLTPLLAHRLSRDLIRPDLVAWLRHALVNFLKSPIEIEADGHEYLRIESRIQVAILAEVNDLPKTVVDFVSAAHWFQAGIRLYHARRRETAYRILKKAYSKRAEFSTVSRTELTRYYCLSAIQNRRYDEAERCITKLDSVYQTVSMAAFLRATLLENKRKFVEAISEYERSLELNKGKESRLERTYRPLIRCILGSPRPDFKLAATYAMEWINLRKTVFSMMALARVYLHWKYRGHTNQRVIPGDIDTLYSDALANLERDPGVGSAHFELKAEEAEFSGDFEGSLDYMDRAINADPRFELRSERWLLMAKTGVPKLADQLLGELKAAKNNPEYRSNWLPFLPALAGTYARALKIAGKPLSELNTFAPELSSDEIGGIITRVNESQ